ncbi:phosphoglycerate kinase, partial [Mycoplasmopsis agassizii]|uniref:phosphoglycerate kinase n=1 Tax=Mycoplasmopsis agassizii TaxID=33922 RepID=UPI0009D7DA6D
MENITTKLLPFNGELFKAKVVRGIMKKFITDLSLSGKKVIVRLDLNVPIDKKTGKITSLKRIKEAIPTINY